MSGGDEEGGHRATLADLMKHARHDGKGMVSPLKPCQCVCLCSCVPALLSPLCVYLLQFFRHMRALLLKRFQYFKRDLKGFLFLVFIPIAVVLAIVAIITVSVFLVPVCLCAYLLPSGVF